VWLRMVTSRNRIRELRLAEAQPAIKVPLNFHVDKSRVAVLEGCPANPDKF
jgi:hypothetical protein